MKKILLVLFVTLFSLNIFADSRSCEVWNAGKGGARATIRNTTDDVSNSGWVDVYVDLSASLDKDTEVVVNVYDISGVFIESSTVNIQKGSRVGFKSIEVGKSYKICTFKINGASCM